MKRIRPQFFLFFLFFSILLIFADSRGFLSPVRTGVQFVFDPFELGVYSAKNSVLESVSFLTFWKSGEQRIKNLEQRNLELIGVASQSKRLQQENEQLRKQLGIDALPGQKKLPASVLGVSRFMTIGRGFRDGVRLGQGVIYLDNLVGKVERVDYAVSQVTLPTDSNVKIPVRVGASGTVLGIATGQFNSSIVLDQVAQNEEIKDGDLIFTTGDGGFYVPDLIVGKIKKITSLQTDLFKRAEVDPIIAYDKLRTVFVLIQ